MKVVAIQHDICWEDREATLSTLAPVVADVAPGADLVVLAEMFAVGFTMDTGAVAESPEGPTTQWLVDQAARHDAWIAGSAPIVMPGADRPSNVLVLTSPEGTVHRYAKRHPFSFAGEHEHYLPGDKRVTVDIRGMRVSPTVCYDLRFADSFTPIAQDTDLYLVVASWPSSRQAHWDALLPARAIENQAYVLGVNRVGDGGGLSYGGGTCIVDPTGQVVGAPAGECTLDADLDPARVAAVRAEFPFLADRRSD